YAQPCEHVVVTNCILSTPCNAIRVGVGNGEIRHCSFQNIIVKQSSRAISVISSYAESSHGTCIEQIDFSDFIIDAMTPLVIAAGPGASSPGAIRDLRFSRFTISATAGSQIVGKPHFPIQRIQLTDFDWHIKGGAQNDAFVHEMPSVLSHHGYVGI